ncbi:protein translocase SEC61 complex subunit gamma [Candidatus Pacearchaeota archaeon]|nr:protein translocase SEC61 complex subunit gamma [Candidatus Pacearchaeota archaeon]
MAKLLIQTKSFLVKCKRVWHALKKPSRQEFEQVSKVSALGILALGIFGFLISIVMKALF